MSTPQDIPSGHARAATPEELTGQWRQGMSNPFAIYVQLGPEPSKEDDPFVGSLVTPEAAAEAVRAVNADRGAGLDLDRAERALRTLLAHLDYDLHKGIERDEETGEDTYPQVARDFARYYQAAEATP